MNYDLECFFFIFHFLLLLQQLHMEHSHCVNHPQNFAVKWTTALPFAQQLLPMPMEKRFSHSFFLMMFSLSHFLPYRSACSLEVFSVDIVCCNLCNLLQQWTQSERAEEKKAFDKENPAQGKFSMASGNRKSTTMKQLAQDILFRYIFYRSHFYYKINKVCFTI